MLVRRHNLRNVLNEIKLREISQASGLPITHCLATIHDRQKMTLSEAYSLKGGKTKLKGDGILSVIHTRCSSSYNTSYNKKHQTSFGYVRSSQFCIQN
jgi:hypothetical protein